MPKHACAEVRKLKAKVWKFIQTVPRGMNADNLRRIFEVIPIEYH